MDKGKNVKLLIEISAISYLMGIMKLALSFAVCEIFGQNVSELGPIQRSNVNMPIVRPYATFYVLAIAMFTTSVTVCEIFEVEICMTLT